MFGQYYIRVEKREGLGGRVGGEVEGLVESRGRVAVHEVAVGTRSKKEFSPLNYDGRLIHLRERKNKGKSTRPYLYPLSFEVKRSRPFTHTCAHSAIRFRRRTVREPV
ncbi:hypothetical protein OUZ56_003062 [Daphnia magna]|uniref:Uncharacterized protein n=1 Tax=Daphnia magna TaxID=35525 RepID=A0ABR0A7M4_9CRUS|nr:hypothetical protein OUZ56_003062 [Daphnia magna]